MPKAVGGGKCKVALVVCDDALGKIHGNGFAGCSHVLSFRVIEKRSPAEYIECVELPVDGAVSVVVKHPSFQGVVDANGRRFWP